MVLLDSIGSPSEAVIVLTEISGFIDVSESRSAMESLQRASDTGALTTIAVNNGLANEGIRMDKTASAVKVTSGSVAAGNNADRSETQSSTSVKKHSWILPAVICAAASVLLLMAIVGSFAWRRKRAAADSVTSHQTRTITASAVMVANTTTPKISSMASSSDDEQVPATDQQSRQLRTTPGVAENMMLTNDIKQQDQVRVGGVQILRCPLGGWGNHAIIVCPDVEILKGDVPDDDLEELGLSPEAISVFRMRLWTLSQLGDDLFQEKKDGVSSIDLLEQRAPGKTGALKLNNESLKEDFQRMATRRVFLNANRAHQAAKNQSFENMPCAFGGSNPISQSGVEWAGQRLDGLAGYTLKAVKLRLDGRGGQGCVSTA
ncbi:hypothetical protein CYMTET_53666 [Cymbomonas tetramitiformis]|uniref:Uncharacterized protein n=1 Tax=Cymbomonas tetramitiformis TaxID=36881 RepID=A0AAE0BGF6_9CHLO|nr:hypothetical protein CYMTET_53666 [Cymbomonas tetramitiformis]